MYLVTLINDGVRTQIHGRTEKLSSGNVVQGINTIDSFSLSLLPFNIGFNRLYEYKTLIEVYNTNRNRYEFQGRVLVCPDSMDDKGTIKKEVTCESFLGYFCDSMQEYVEERNWGVRELLNYIVGVHNSQVEEEKRFTVRTVTVEDPNNNLYCGIQRENTWETIKKKLIEVLGGEIRFEVIGGKLYLDYLKEIGETKTTPIALSKNMKSITREKDPTAFITRLIPLGAKLGDDTEERLDISSVNGGVKYIDDTQAIEQYGVHVGYVEFDDVTDPNNLLSKGREWLTDNNKVQVKYSVTALDLSLLGLDYDDFEKGNKHPIQNALLGIDDTARIIKKNIDVCEEIKSTIEIGDNFKTLTELQREQANKLNLASQTVGKIVADYVTNQKLNSTIQNERIYTTSLISQTAGDITFSVSTEGTEAKLSASLSKDSGGSIISLINASADVINIASNRLTISSTYFQLSANGTITATNANITGNITATSLTIKEGATVTGSITANSLLHRNSTGDRELSSSGGYMRMTRYNSSGGRRCYSEFYDENIGFYNDEDYAYGVLHLYAGDGLHIEAAPYGSLNGTWYLNNSTVITSDREKKNSIEGLDERYSDFFDYLTPARFKYNDGTSDRYHTGFIAQDVEEAITQAGLTTQEVAAFVNLKGFSGLRYSEFIALCVNEIQNLKKRVIALETV